MKRFKLLFALLLIVCTICVLAACGEKDVAPADNKQQSSEDGKTADNLITADMTLQEAYEAIKNVKNYTATYHFSSENNLGYEENPYEILKKDLLNGCYTDEYPTGLWLPSWGIRKNGGIELISHTMIYCETKNRMQYTYEKSNSKIWNDENDYDNGKPYDTIKENKKVIKCELGFGVAGNLTFAQSEAEIPEAVGVEFITNATKKDGEWRYVGENADKYGETLAYLFDTRIILYDGYVEMLLLNADIALIRISSFNTTEAVKPDFVNELSTDDAVWPELVGCDGIYYMLTNNEYSMDSVYLRQSAVTLASEINGMPVILDGSIIWGDVERYPNCEIRCYFDRNGNYYGDASKGNAGLYDGWDRYTANNQNITLNVKYYGEW